MFKISNHLASFNVVNYGVNKSYKVVSVYIERDNKIIDLITDHSIEDNTVCFVPDLSDRSHDRVTKHFKEK